jgi:hypothetical protein
MTHGCLGIHENLLVGDNFEVTYLGMRGVNDIPFSILLTRGCYVSVEEVGMYMYEDIPKVIDIDQGWEKTYLICIFL